VRLFGLFGIEQLAVGGDLSGECDPDSAIFQQLQLEVRNWRFDFAG